MIKVLSMTSATHISHVLAVCALMITAIVHADENLPNLIEQISPSVVSLKVETASGEIYTGTGFFVDSEGAVATNFHVIEGGRRITARTSKGVTLFCKGVLTFDKQRDLALLRFSGKSLPSLPLADAAKIKRGETVAVIGSPLGLEQTVSSGIVSAMRTDRNWEQVQITAPISNGSSGSPVVNMQGEVIGIATFIRLNGQSLNFASSVKHLSSLVTSLDNLEPVALADALPQTKTKQVSKAQKPKPQEDDNSDNIKASLMEDFWNGYWESMRGSDPHKWASFFANLVDYQYKDKGLATHEDLASGARDLYNKFPTRSYKVIDEPHIRPLDDKLTRCSFEFAYSYNYSGAKRASGTSHVEMNLLLTNRGWRIYKFREKVNRD